MNKFNKAKRHENHDKHCELYLKHQPKEEKEFYEESIRLQKKLLSIPTNYTIPPEWGLGKKWEEFEGSTRVSFNKGKMTLQKYTGEKWVETNQEEYQELIRLFHMSEDIIN